MVKKCKYCRKGILDNKVYCNSICMTHDYGKNKIAIQCQSCDKNILKPLSQRHYKYCSQGCYRRSIIGSKRPLFSKKMKGRVGVRNGKKITEEQRLNMSGENHWRYGTGKKANPLKKKIRSIDEYLKWRLSVYRRDGFRCRECKVRGLRLECHHINSFSRILSDNKIETVQDAINCSDLWKISNGLTLCNPCHKKTDSYGKA